MLTSTNCQSCKEILNFASCNWKMMQKTNTLPAVQRLLMATLFVFGALTSFGQKKYTDDADRAFERGAYAQAAKLYLSAYAKIKGIEDKGEVMFRVGECHRLMLDPAGAEEYYNKAVGFRYFKREPEVFLRYAEVMMAQNKFTDAIAKYNEYAEKGGDRSVAQERIREAEAAALALEMPPSRYIVEPVPALNSPQFDYAPLWSSKKNDEIIFASSRPSSSGSGEDPITGEAFMDLFKAERDKKGKWSTPVPLNNTVNTPSSEGGATFDKKFQTMYFTRCVVDKKSNFACDIFYARRSGKDFGPAEPMNIIDREENDSSQVGHPCLSADDLFMIFSSDMPGGYGGKDLWYIQYDKKADSWSKPKNMGSKINTSGDEMFPHLRDNGTLYFSSTGHGSTGGLDVFYAESTGEMEFGDVKTLPPPLNSPSDDFGIIFDGDKDQGFFTSNRPGGKGKDDIYEFKMPPLEFKYIANVYDYDTGTPLGNAKVNVQGTDGGSYELTTDGNGGVSLVDGEIKTESTYSIDVALEGYIGAGDQFSTVNMKESTTFAREYFLKEIQIGKEYDLPLVLYPFDKWDLLINDEVNSADSLNYLYDLMVRNPNFVIEIDSHTDTRGKADYNLTLSQKRAETCVSYLISRGIAADRLVARGKGKNEPKISDAEINAMATEEERERAHQVNRRTVFQILRYDYVPKEEN